MDRQVLPPRLPNAIGVEHIDTIVKYLNRKKGHNNKSVDFSNDIKDGCCDDDDVVVSGDCDDVDVGDDDDSVDTINHRNNKNSSYSSSDKTPIVHAVATDPFIFNDQVLIPILPLHRQRLLHNERC